MTGAGWAYDAVDVERRVTEPPKAVERGAGPGVPLRTPFSRDRARVLHSAAFRRLAGKTQVVAPDEDDVPRTRLTHSLEVAQIARELGGQLGCDADLVDLAGLAHDIGHPPFGHNGEAALDAVGGPAGGFEANAQNLRLLTTLEAKVVSPEGVSAGLNLTRAALDAVVKYPWARTASTGRKFGVYPTEAAVFDWVRPRGGTRCCLEAQVMDWADDVAYSVHDVEDGILGDRLDLARLADPSERAAVAETAAVIGGRSAGDMATALTELLGLPVVRDALAYRPGVAGAILIKRMTSELTGRFAAGAVAATVAMAGPGPHGRYSVDLTVPDELRAEVAVLKAVATRYVMDDPARRAVQDREQELLVALVAALADRGSAAMDAAHGERYREASDDAERLRVVLDQVSLLTDAQAVAWKRRLAG